jgi:hypothetical protein
MNGSISRKRRSLVAGTMALFLSLLLLPGCAENVNDILEEAEKGDPESVKEAVIRLGEILSQKERAGYP